METHKGQQDKQAQDQAQAKAEIQDYYTVLNLPKNASSKDVRDAYYRLKNTYSNNNQALYSLIEEGEINESLLVINEAYEVLYKSESRLAYDQDLLAAGLTKASDLCPDVHQAAGCAAKLGQAQRPFASKTLGATDAAQPDAARAETSTETATAAQAAYPLKQPPDNPYDLDQTFSQPGLREGLREGVTQACAETTGQPCSPFEGLPFLATSSLFQRGSLLGRHAARKMVANKALNNEVQEHIKRLISDHDLGDGNLYRRIRQTVGVSQEEMQDHIKITVGYIQYLEENRFDLLPQPVYVRGFLKSYLRFLGVSNCDRLVNAYVERFNDWIANQNP